MAENGESVPNFNTNHFNTSSMPTSQRKENVPDFNTDHFNTKSMPVPQKRERCENVNHLDTAHFNDTILTYAKYIRQFESIVSNVDSIINRMAENWKGKGRDAFEKDCRVVQINLKDISDIMYDLRDALIDAHAGYMQTDQALSKDFES